MIIVRRYNSGMDLLPSSGEFAQAQPDDAGADDPTPAASATRWHCACNGTCTSLAAAQCLYRMTLDLLSGCDSGPATSHELLRPLGVVVARQRTREGHSECTRFADALAVDDHAAALAACRRLIEMETVLKVKPAH